MNYFYERYGQSAAWKTGRSSPASLHLLKRNEWIFLQEDCVLQEERLVSNHALVGGKVLVDLARPMMCEFPSARW